MPIQRLGAIDVSPAMLRYATRSVPCPNVHFQLSSGAKVPLNDGAVDAVFSTHVFHHVNTIDEAINMFEEVFRVLSPTGSMMIHLPVIIWPGGATKRFHVAVDRLKAALGNIRAAVRRRAFKLGLQKKPIMRMTHHDIDRLYDSLCRVGFKDVEFTVVFAPVLGLRRHTFVFGHR